MRTGAIVDGFSTGRHLVSAFREFDVRCVHVSSSDRISPWLAGSFDPGEYHDSHPYRGDRSATLSWLADHRVEFVIPGADTGVELADWLSERLGLPCNGSATSAARRDKGSMADAVRAAGLRAAAHLRTADAAGAAAWARRHDRWPVVVKPSASAGTDSVVFCADAPAVEQTAARILSTPNKLGLDNQFAIVQEYLHGEQYYVNTISVAGGHYVSEIWHDHKRRIDGAGAMDDLAELLPPHGRVQDTLVTYVCQVLDALGIAWGPAHTEVMLTGTGPVLIETAARPVGSMLLEAVRHAAGEDHVQLTAECYARPDRLAALAGTRYTLHSGLMMVTLISTRSGIVSSVDGFVRLKQLESYFDILPLIRRGDRLNRTVDYFTTPGLVFLMHDDREQMLRDYRTIRAWEAADLLYQAG